MEAIRRSGVLVLSMLAIVSSLLQAEPSQNNQQIPENPGRDPVSEPSGPDAYTLVGAQNFLTSYPAINEDDGTINVVIEIPAGSSAKWEVDKSDGTLRWEFESGKPRVVRYLGYPANYGMVPRTLLPNQSGGDGDPLDVLVLGPSVARGSIVRTRVIGVLKLWDDGEVDHKLIAVLEMSQFDQASNLQELNDQFPGLTEIVRIWFENYKGPDRIEVQGYEDIESAQNILRTAINAFANRPQE